MFMVNVDRGKREGAALAREAVTKSPAADSLNQGILHADGDAEASDHRVRL